MGRGKVINTMTTPEWIANINPENKALLEDFIEYCDTIGRSDTTIKEYSENIRVAFCWGLNNINNKLFTDWTKRDVQRYQNYLINTCKLGSARVRLLKAALSSMSNYIENILDDEYPNFKNIIKKIENPPQTKVLEKTIITEEDVEKLLNKLTENGKYEDACLIALAAFSGRRKSELLRFKVSDFSDDKLVCNGTLYKSSPIKTKGRGKEGKLLECYTLSKEVKPYIDRWMEYRKNNNIESEWLICNVNKPEEPVKVSTLNSWYKRYSKLLGKEFYMHSLRHGFCTRLLRAGIPAIVVKEMIGWESVDMVSVYSDITTDESVGKYFGNKTEIRTA